MEATKRMRRRESVVWFSGQMEQILRDNDHKHGWHNMSDYHIAERIHMEWAELKKALALGTSDLKVIQECVDIANFAMMLADNYRAK